MTMTYNKEWEVLIIELQHLRKNNSIALEALTWAKEMFIARDEMNSKVHCAPVRYSPITERVIQAIKEIEGK